ncbi:hydroxypyruvate isomerase family protein [Primorskyibacter sp. S87]|uniref:hydroxypyruvate isomerase family protein n=1 Tax=Primorskyibacter sp. S87 TaxID=3415126 RepID=UPI003C7E77B7
MPKFAANISLLFKELPYLDRFAAARRAGFDAVEILFPYDLQADETKNALQAAGLELVLINAPPPGEAPGYPALPEGGAKFRRDMVQVMRYADSLTPGLIHVMAGYEQGIAAQAAFIRNLAWLADTFPKQRFTIEPLNPKDQPGYFLNDYQLAAEVLAKVARPNVGLQYDFYHAEMIHGDALSVWRDYGEGAFHVQIGSAPDRTEPDAAEIAPLFEALDQSGYTGWVSAEYNPSTARTEASLGWMA